MVSGCRDAHPYYATTERSPPPAERNAAPGVCLRLAPHFTWPDRQAPGAPGAAGAGAGRLVSPPGSLALAGSELSMSMCAVGSGSRFAIRRSKARCTCLRVSPRVLNGGSVSERGHETVPRCPHLELRWLAASSRQQLHYALQSFYNIIQCRCHLPVAIFSVRTPEMRPQPPPPPHRLAGPLYPPPSPFSIILPVKRTPGEYFGICVRYLRMKCYNC